MRKITELTHDLLKYQIKAKVAIDFTMGQGFDTVFMASLENIEHVYAFDIQKEAIQETMQHLKEVSLEHKVTCILDGHENVDQYVDAYDCGIFNFGYLPQYDHCITTLLSTSKIAVEKALQLLNKKGLLILVIYPGHVEGKKESQFFDDYITHLDPSKYVILKQQMILKPNAPYIYAIEKIK